MSANKPFLLLLSALTILSFSRCTSNEIGNSEDVNPDAIYFDYQVWADQGDSNATVKMQFRFGGRNGTTLVLNNPSRVQLDGHMILVDSSKMSGAYYESSMPLDGDPDHTIVFTDQNGRQYREDFSFTPIAFADEIPASIGRKDLEIALNGVKGTDYIRVVLSDTSHMHDGINRIDTITDGKVLIAKRDLDSLSNGPLHLTLIQEREAPIKKGTPQGGKLSTSFTISREFQLQ